MVVPNATLVSPNDPALLNRPDLSVVIPTYNTRLLTAECLRSIRATTGGLACEIIVVDDASSDGTSEALPQEFQGIQLIRNPASLGYGGSANQGLAVARGRYVAIANSDTLVLDSALQALVAYLEAQPRVGAVGPRLLNPDGSLQPSVTRHPTVLANFIRLIVPPRLLEWRPVLNLLRALSRRLGLNLGRLGQSPSGPVAAECLKGAFFLVRREVVEQTGGFDADGFYLFGEEADWFRRIHQVGWQVAFCPLAQVIHLGSQTVGQFRHRYFIQQYKSLLRYYEKHGTRRTLLLYKLLLGTVFALRAAGCRLLALVPGSRCLEYLRCYECYVTILKLFANRLPRSQNVMRAMHFTYIPPVRR